MSTCFGSRPVTPGCDSINARVISPARLQGFDSAGTIGLRASGKSKHARN